MVDSNNFRQAIERLHSSSSSQVCILLLGFSRPEFIANRISEAILSVHELGIPFVISIDGPISDKFEFVRRICESDNHLIMIEYEKNLGGATHYLTSVREVLSIFEAVIVIEDDVCLGTDSISSLTSVYMRLIHTGEEGLIISGFSPFPFVGGDLVHRLLAQIWYPAKYFSCWGHLIDKKAFAAVVETQNSLSSSSSPVPVLIAKNWQKLSIHSKGIWLQRARRGTYDYLVQLAIFMKAIPHYKPILRRFDNEGIGDALASHTSGQRNQLWGKIRLVSKIHNIRIIGNRNYFLLILLNFVDNILMAQDTILNTRGRNSGLRSLVKSLAKRR